MLGDKGASVPSIQFKGKSVVEVYHHTVPHHGLEFDSKLSVLGKGKKPGLDGNLIIEGDNLLALKALVYREKVWMHPEELRRFEREHNVRVRPMLVPLNLK